MNKNEMKIVVYPLTKTLTGRFDKENGVLTISGTGEMPDYNNLLKIPWYDYRDTITTVNIQDEVTTIGNNAFLKCASLESITIGKAVTSIGDKVFAGCSSLGEIVLNPTTPPSIETGAFHGVHLSSVNLKFPNGGEDDYRKKPYWQDFFKDKENEDIVFCG
jgi:hypothetical protein